jgi:two-component system, NarL family, sensor histidine kinase UhpB
VTARRPQSRWNRALRVIIFVVLLGAVAALPFRLAPSSPGGTVILTEALVSLDGDTAQPVMLPHRWPIGFRGGQVRAQYDVRFELDEVPPDGILIMFPAIRQNPLITLNGSRLQSGGEPNWFSPVLGGVYLLAAPDVQLVAGENRLEIVLERRSGNIPGYLSQIHLGNNETITIHDQMVAFMPGYMRAVSYALLVLTLVGVLVIWSARPRDPIFGWLATAALTNLVVALVESDVLGFEMADVQPYLFSTYGVFGVLAAGIALALVDRPRPRWLIWVFIAAPAVGLGLALSGWVPLFVAAISAIIIAIIGHAFAVAILGRDFVSSGRWETGLLAIPFFLTIWLALHDIGLTIGMIEGGFLLSSYIRSLVVLCVIVILMRRLAVTLNFIDRANETLSSRLAEREAELSVLHKQQQLRTAETVREEERQRLMHDLHDGVSGHLISIIALAERGPTETGAIEKAAREALDDLRLVVNSLDIGDRDLPLALAAFRDRILRQLRRLGVDLVWSMDQLPEVSGLTPASALSILRILQEAVTNALKHGPATRIAIRGQPGVDAAIVTVENDGKPIDRVSKGYGLGNMNRRAAQLGGSAVLSETSDGVRLTLTLPSTLPVTSP